MLHSTSQALAMDNASTKRNPFDLFASIFRRKTQESDNDNAETGEESLENSNSSNQGNDEVVTKKARSSPVPITGGPTHYDRTPELSRSSSPASVKTRDVDSDMAALRLSRQDNPYLQQQLERMSYQEDIQSCQSSRSTSPQKLPQLKCEVDTTDEDCVSLHQHLIRSPPPQFPQNISQFVFLSKSDSPQHFHREMQWIEGNMVKTMSVSPTQFDSFEGQRLKDLNPLMTKAGVDALDPRVREVLEFQRQKYHSDQRNFDSHVSELGTRRASDISPVPNKFLSIPTKTKWLAKAGFRPFSFPSVPMVTGSLPGLSGVNGDVDSRCLAPVKDNRQLTGGPHLVASSSVQDLCTNNHQKQSVFTLYGMNHTSSLEPLINSRSKSSLDSG